MEEQKQVNYTIMAFNNTGDLIDTNDYCKVFVVVEKSIPVKVMSEGVYSLQVDTHFEIGDYIMGGGKPKEPIFAIPISKDMYDSHKHEIIGRVVGKNGNLAKVMI